MLLAKEGASTVMVADLAVDAARDTVAECQAVATNTKFKGFAMEVDVTKEDSVVGLFGKTAKELGRIDYCVNCAGVSEKSILNWNLRAPYYNSSRT